MNATRLQQPSIKLVGRVRVELTASWSQTKRLTPRLTSVYKMAPILGNDPSPRIIRFSD
jgi:hypothetical protein